MADQLDPEVQSQNLETATEQEVTENNQNDIQGDNPSHVESPEDVEWSKLSGSTQKRVRSLLEQRNQALQEAQFYKQKVEEAYVPPAPVVPAQDPEQVSEEEQRALQNLRKKGILTKEDLKDLEDKMILDNEYNRLESMYDGSDGRPLFDRLEIQQHMVETGIFNPEKAYEDLYRDELFDYKMKTVQRARKTSYSERPSAPSQTREEPITLQGIQERLKQPDGKEWWEKNREKILPLMGQLQSGS